MISQQSQASTVDEVKLRFPPVDSVESVQLYGIVEEACRRLRIPAEDGLVAATGEWRWRSLSASNARALLADFQNLDDILIESQRVAFNRISQGGDRKALKRIYGTLAQRQRGLLESFSSALAKADAPREALRELFVASTRSLRPEMISAVLGIREESVGGDLSRHPSSERKNLFGRGGFMYQPSGPQELWRIFSLLKFKVGSLFVDLGSGYGHVVFQGAITRPDVRFKGIELMPARVMECECVRALHELSNLSFVAGDVTQGGFSDADIIFLFNPFPPDTKGAVAERINHIAKTRPLAVLDYEGLVTKGVSSLVSVDAQDLTPYQLLCSRRFLAESCERVGVCPPQKGPQPARR